MTAHHTEEVLILSLMQCLYVFRHSSLLTTAELQLTAHLLVGTDVELGDVNLTDNLRILLYGSLEVFHRRTVDVVVTLHTDTVDRRTHLLHLLHHIIYTVALGWLGSVIVVVEQLNVGVGLAGKLEHLDDKLLAAEVNHLRLTIGAGCLFHPRRTTSVAVGNGFIEHVPCIYDILVAVHYGMYMRAQTLVEHFLSHFLAFLVGKHPVGKLRVPSQTVSAHLHAVGTAPVSDAVGSGEVPHVFLRMNLSRLHGVFSRDTIEVFLHDSHLFWRGNITEVECHTHGEIIFVGVFVACWLFYWKLSWSLCHDSACSHRQHQREASFYNKLVTF